MTGPLLTTTVHDQLCAALQTGASVVECSLDLGRSKTVVRIDNNGWHWQGRRYSYLKSCKVRTIYYWNGESFQAAARFTTALIKLVPTEWGPPTFEIDGIKMLPTARVSPYADAMRKVQWVEPPGKVILDTCAGLGYFAACCLELQAERVISCEKN